MPHAMPMNPTMPNRALAAGTGSQRNSTSPPAQNPTHMVASASAAFPITAVSATHSRGRSGGGGGAAMPSVIVDPRSHPVPRPRRRR